MLSLKQLFSCILLLMSSILWGQSRYAQAEALYEEALASYKKRSLAHAEQLIEEAIYLNPTPGSYYLSGLIYEALGEDMKALTAYEATVKMDPEYHEAIFQKGLIYLNTGDAEKALEDFDRLIEHREETETRGIFFQVDESGGSQNKVMSVANLTGQLYHYRGQAYQKLGKYDEAMNDYTLALAEDSATDYYISRALLKSKLGEDSLATIDLKAALELEPRNQLAWYNLALLNPAMELPDSLLEATSFSAILNLLGSRALEDGRFEEAKKYFSLYLDNQEYDALGYVNRGRTFLKCKEYPKARQDFEKARKIDPSRAEALYLIGNSYFFEKEYQSALAYYNQYLAIDPTNGMVWYNGAMSNLELGNDHEACHFLNNADKYGMQHARGLMARYCQ